MNKRVIAILLAILLLANVVPVTGAEAASGVCFISLNERLLELSSQALTIDSSIYVPANILDYFKIYYAYHAESSIATLYTSTKQVHFDLNSGNTYDSSGEYYSGSATLNGGRVYVPLSLVCSLFGLSWSYVNGDEYGDVCRIKDGSDRLSDTLFIEAASSLMQERYEAYYNGGSTGETPTPGETTSPGVGNDGQVYLSFQGMPSDILLDLLSKKEAKACFFLAADDVRANPDMVRRIAGEGHSLGALCSSDPETEYDEISTLLFEAAKVTTVLIAVSSSDYNETCLEMAEKQGLVFCNYNIDGVQDGKGISYSSLITAYLEYYRDRADVRIQCSDFTDLCMSTVLSYMQTYGFTVKVPNEVTS